MKTSDNREIKVTSIRLVAPSIVRKGMLQYSAPEYAIEVIDNVVLVVPASGGQACCYSLSNVTEMQVELVEAAAPQEGRTEPTVKVAKKKLQ